MKQKLDIKFIKSQLKEARKYHNHGKIFPLTDDVDLYFSRLYRSKLDQRPGYSWYQQYNLVDKRSSHEFGGFSTIGETVNRLKNYITKHNLSFKLTRQG